VHCLYAILRVRGDTVDFTELLKPEYIGSYEGSTLAELQKAAEDHGLYAAATGKMTTRALRRCLYPVILHVRPNADSKEYTHYELFLGVEDGKAKLLNPPGPAELVSFESLAARWDRNGLIVAAEPININRIYAPARMAFIGYAVIVIGSIVLLHWSKRTLPTGIAATRIRMLGLSMTQGALLCVAALVGGATYRLAGGSGLLGDTGSTQAIQRAHAVTFIPKIGQSRCDTFLRKGAVLIDARFVADYRLGHVDGAVNIPVDANDAQREKIAASIPKDARVVVYCQSARCGFAGNVAVWLRQRGFANVVVYRGGWVDWVAKTGKNDKEAKP
jgi:rhodanese-related sulfurtransferase